jgi:hypothetical protein
LNSGPHTSALATRATLPALCVYVCVRWIFSK